MAEKLMFPCDLCSKMFQMGPHIYDGKFIVRYQLSVCKSCWDNNWDGWGPYLERRLIAHLRAKDIPVPERNAKGWIPRE